MKLRKLLTVKPHKYGTRHLVAGDEYEVPERHAVALVAGRKARFVTGAMKTIKERVMPTVPPAPAVQPAEEKPAAEVTREETQGTALDLLREKAERLGIEVDRRWGIARLQQEIRHKKGLPE